MDSRYNHSQGAPTVSPVIHREHGYTFYFVVADLAEPPHIHVGEGKARRSVASL